jgi:hypothetical protein
MQKQNKGIPNVKVCQLWINHTTKNLDIKVKVIGMGKVKSQSLQAGK